MAKKIVFVQGSPRKNGNTRAMARVAMDAARGLGAAVSEIDATRLTFEAPGCIGCYRCQQSEVFECAIGDPLAKSVATLPGFDVIVMATPIYWWSFTAQIKIFIDRMFSLSKFPESGEIRTALAGKTFGLLATGGGGLADNLELLEAQWRQPAEMMGSPFHSCLFADTPPEAGVLADDPAAVAKAAAFGRRLAE